MSPIHGDLPTSSIRKSLNPSWIGRDEINFYCFYLFFLTILLKSDRPIPYGTTSVQFDQFWHIDSSFSPTLSFPFIPKLPLIFFSLPYISLPSLGFHRNWTIEYVFFFLASFTQHNYDERCSHCSMYWYQQFIPFSCCIVFCCMGVP